MNNNPNKNDHNKNDPNKNDPSNNIIFIKKSKNIDDISNNNLKNEICSIINRIKKTLEKIKSEDNSFNAIMENNNDNNLLLDKCKEQNNEDSNLKPSPLISPKIKIVVNPLFSLLNKNNTIDPIYTLKNTTIDLSNNITLELSNNTITNLIPTSKNTTTDIIHTPKSNKINDIKHNTNTDIGNNIDMKIIELLDKIKAQRDYLESLDKSNKNSLNKNSNMVNKNVGTSDKILANGNTNNILTKRTRHSLFKNEIDSITNNLNQKYYNLMAPLNRPKSLSSTNKYHPYYNSVFDKTFNKPFMIKHPLLTPQQPLIVKKKVTIKVEINSIKDLLNLIDEYPIQYDIEYNINMQSIHNIKDPLNELNNMIGMNNLKDSIVDQILYFVQNLHQSKTNEGDFMHTCIYGPPGTGKTEVAKIMGKIYSKLGVLKKNVFRKVTRSDLIAGYLGQTALKTRDAVKDCLGGVMFIDEAYALGNMEKRDSFAKECIDTLCEALSDHKNELMVIIAGYESELKKCFFAYNQGLESRFSWRFKTDDYNAEELRKIFVKKVNEAGWTIKKDNIKDEWFKDNMDFFKFYGRDMETLFSKVKIAHSRRVFCLEESAKKNLTNTDLEKGFEKYLSNDNIKERKELKEQEKRIRYSMYS